MVKFKVKFNRGRALVVHNIDSKLPELKIVAFGFHMGSFHITSLKAVKPN